jgi:hypothetical protein
MPFDGASSPPILFLCCVRGLKNSVHPQTSENSHTSDLAQHLPKVWIGYLLCVATFVDEAIFFANHPEIVSLKFFLPPLHLFLLGFLSLVYWLVSIHKLHVVLSLVPGWRHPISPGRAVWFHFIPVYNLYWLYKWPRECANFVNWRLQGSVLQPRNAGLFVLGSYVLSVLIGSLMLVFFSLSFVVTWIRRALTVPFRLPPADGGSGNSTTLV